MPEATKTWFFTISRDQPLHLVFLMRQGFQKTIEAAQVLLNCLQYRLIAAKHRESAITAQKPWYADLWYDIACGRLGHLGCALFAG